MRLVVNNKLKDVESSNLIGIIEGDLEPDRYVIIGKFCWTQIKIIGSTSNIVRKSTKFLKKDYTIFFCCLHLNE